MAIEIELPSVAAGMEEATLVRWVKAEGDQITRGETVAEMESDKAVMEMGAEADGVLGRILVPGGTEGVAVGTVIGVLLEPGEDKSALASYEQSSAPSTDVPEPETALEPEAPAAQLPAGQPAPQSAQGKRVFASPLAKRLATEYDIDLTSMQGSGPHGRIVRVDVERVREGAPGQAASMTSAPAAKPAAGTAVADGVRVEQIPNSGMRKTIGRRLTESKQHIPHFYLTVDVQVDELLALRSRLNAKGSQAEPSYRLSVNDIVVYASARALRRVPEVNSSWSEEAVLRYLDVDVCVAVATEGGLVTPVIREADRKGLAEISAEIRELAHKARDGKLAPSEFQGGGFTISNLGMYGIREFAAIINPPQTAILAVGAVEKRPVVKDDALAVGKVMTMTLSADHRVVDGAVGASFLAELRGLLEDPLNLLV